MTGDVVDFPGHEVVYYVCKSLTGVLDVVDDALVASVYYVGFLVQGMVDEFRDETAVGSVVLARPITVDGADAHGLCAELPRGVQTHQLPGPLRNRVVVELLDGKTVHDVLGHSAAIVAVYLSATEKD